LLLVTGAACLGWVSYELFATNSVSEHVASAEKSQLRERWGHESPRASVRADPQHSAATSQDDPQRGSTVSPIPDDAFALLRIPAFGDDYEVPILSGTQPDVLSRGLGHYRSTAMPGEVGNFAVAGHRVTHGQPFARLLELDRGDEIVVETRTAIYSYVLDVAPRDLTVKPSDAWVLDPVPGKKTAPTRALLTLTTCEDLFRRSDPGPRLIRSRGGGLA
jgi:sortase A